jgi:hypothetical protein
VYKTFSFCLNTIASARWERREVGSDSNKHYLRKVSLVFKYFIVIPPPYLFRTHITAYETKFSFSVKWTIERADNLQHWKIAMDFYSAQFWKSKMVYYPLTKFPLLVRVDLVDPASCRSIHLRLS